MFSFIQSRRLKSIAHQIYETTRPRVVPNLYYFLSYMEHKIKLFGNITEKSHKGLELLYMMVNKLWQDFLGGQSLI